MKTLENLRACYRMSTDVGDVTLEMPFRLSPDDAADVIDQLGLIIRQITRRSQMPESDPMLDEETVAHEAAETLEASPRGRIVGFAEEQKETIPETAPDA